MKQNILQLRLHQLLLFIIVLCFISCDGGTKKEHRKTNQKVLSQKQVNTKAPESEKVIHILPLGNVIQENIEVVKSSIKNFYGYDCIVLSQVEPTSDIIAPSGTRYEAGKILKKYRTKDFRIILTEGDIAYPNKEKKSQEYGIFGLGFMPGTTSVVSTFRLKRNVSHKLFLERLTKVALHEIGHNLGLNHCTNEPRCMMNDARGTIKQVDHEKIWFCDKCQMQLKK